MSELQSKDVSDPLKHLFSLTFGRSSPLLDEVTDRVNELVLKSPSKGRKVRFVDHSDADRRNFKTASQSTSKVKLKGILKNQLSPEEKVAAISVLNKSDYSQEDYYSSDSISSDDYSSDFSERKLEEQASSNTGPTFMETDYYTSEASDVSVFPVHVPETEESHCVEANTNSYNELYGALASESEHDANRGSDHLVGMQMISNHIAAIKSEENADLHNVTASKETRKKEKMKPAIFKGTEHMQSPNLIMKYKCNGKNQKRLRKPKLHICVVSLSEKPLCEKRVASNFSKNQKGNCFETYRKKIIERNIFNHNLLASSQTLKLYLTVEEEQTHIPSAKQLKSCVFHAWQKVKNSQHYATDLQKEGISNVSNVGNIKNKNSKESTNAYLTWMRKKEISMKKKRQNSKGQKKLDTSSTSLQKKKTEEEERNMVYNLWKQKKDEEYRKALDKEREKKIEEINKLKEKELQKQEAASAYLAWKEIKQKVNEKKKELEVDLMKQQEEKALEKHERNKEAEEAYIQWILQKETISVKDEYSEHKPPWNPPG